MSFHAAPFTMFLILVIGAIAVVGILSLLSSSNQLNTNAENQGAVPGSIFDRIFNSGICRLYIPCASSFKFNSNCNCDNTTKIECCPVCTGSRCPKYLCTQSYPPCPTQTVTTTTSGTLSPTVITSSRTTTTTNITRSRIQ